MKKFLTFLAILGLVMELAALIMSWPLCFGWHPELVVPFLVCFLGGFVIALFMACTATYWREVFGCNNY